MDNTRRKIVLALLFFVVLFPLYSSAKSGTIDQSCAAKIPGAVRQFVRHDFGSSFSSYEIMAQNDIRCEDPEDMSNVAVVVKTRDGISYYGWFHVHFSHGGEFLSPKHMWGESWKRATAEIDWKKDWCDLIRCVYNDELAEQGCQ